MDSDSIMLGVLVAPCVIWAGLYIADADAAKTYKPPPQDVLMVPMAKSGDSFYVKVEIEGKQRTCLVDTGATATMIPPSWNVRLTGHKAALMDLADGSTAKGMIATLPSMTVDGDEITDLKVIVVPKTEECLLGQSLFMRFSSVTLDYKVNSLFLRR